MSRVLGKVYLFLFVEIVMAIKKIKRIYRIRENESKPIVIEFKRKDGSVVRFRGRKITKKPQKIIFRKIKKVYIKNE